MRKLPLILLPIFTLAFASCSQEKAPTSTESQPKSNETSPTTNQAQEAPKPNPPGTQSIKGQASVTLKGQSWAQPLNHLQIVLMPRDAIPVIKKIREEQWLERASRSNFGDGYNNLDLVSMGIEAQKRSIIPKPAEADPQGFYTIPAVKPGSYALYAQYKSRYGVAYWLLPVDVKDGEDLKLDINNENMTEIFNRIKAQ